MTLQIEMWQLISLAATGLGALVALGRVLLLQIDKRLEARFGVVERDIENWRQTSKDMHESWRQAGQAMNDRLHRVELDMQENWRRVERDLQALRVELPMHYVRREDYVQNQTIIQARLDGLFTKLENFLLRGNHHD